MASTKRPRQPVWLSWVQRSCVGSLLWLLNVTLALVEGCTRFKCGDEQPGRILMLRTAALGDFVMSIPAMQLLRAAYPAAHITLLTTATTDRTTLLTVSSYANKSSPWLDLLPHGLVDEVIVFPFVSYSDLLRQKLLHGKPYDVSFILNEGIGLALSGTAKKIVFLRLIGVYCRIYGIRTRAYPKIFPEVQNGERQLEHHLLAIIRSVEESQQMALVPDPPVNFGLSVLADAESWAQAKLSELACTPANLIIVAPGSRLEFKRWASDNFVQVISAILERPGVNIILVGSGPELSTVNQVQSGCLTVLRQTNRLHNLGGQTSLPQLAALLAKAAVFLGNDGGTCHLAAALGCRVVSIGNGAEIPNSVEPWGSQRLTARFNVSCAPCYCFTHCPKNDNRCVSGITPEQVLKLYELALEESKQSNNKQININKAV